MGPTNHEIYDAIHKAVWLQIQESRGTPCHRPVKERLESVLATAHKACYPSKEWAQTVPREMYAPEGE